jgi:hypothetical protein
MGRYLFSQNAPQHLLRIFTDIYGENGFFDSLLRTNPYHSVLIRKTVQKRRAHKTASTAAYVFSFTAFLTLSVATFDDKHQN